MDRNTEYMENLQYSLRNARLQIEAFKSGEKYVRMTAHHRQTTRQLENAIKALKRELEQARRETVKVREIWFEQSAILEKEHQAEKEDLLRQLHKMEERALKAEARCDEQKQKIADQRHELYELKTELEEEKGKNLKLTAQLNRDYENSSSPSSSANKKGKKISNNREKSGKKPGGQPGHTGHSRKKQEPTEVIKLLPSEDILMDPDFKKTNKTIKRQVVEIRVSVIVKEYQADVYYNSKTGERYHAEFPEEAKNDVNYGGSIKAFLYLLNNDCCVSIDKCRTFLSDLTDGKLQISKGMINGLGKEFARKTEKERKALFQRILMSPVMHTDCTNARINGKSAYVFVCATPAGEVLYFSREKKGHEGVKGTVTEDYQGILVHDHESTFYKYGSDHQECLSHILRYLKDSIENEPDRTWNQSMRALLQEMIHYRNTLLEGTEPEETKVVEFERRYREILQKAKEEYDDEPASDYYREGYNLYRRMDKRMNNHLLFLHDIRVPTNNNEAERDLRKYKRKQKQAMSFRSSETLEDLCNGMSMLVMMRQNEENVFNRVSRILD